MSLYSFSSNFAQKYGKYMPDALIFCLLLTFVTFGMAFTLTSASISTALTGWYNGYVSLFTFAFQVLLLFMGGLILVDAPVVGRGVIRLAKCIKTPTGAYISLAIFANISMWLNIYVSVVLTSVFGRYVGRNVKGTDYRLIIAASYSSIAIWHGGISGTVPLTLNTAKNPFFDLMGGRLYPLSETIFTPMNLIACLAVLLAGIFTYWLLAPKKGEPVRNFDYYVVGQLEDDEIKTSGNEKSIQEATFADRLETFRPFSLALGIGMLAYCGIHFGTKGIMKGLELNSLGFLLYGLAFVLHRSPRELLKSFSSRFSAMAQIALQFPLYGGIMGVMNSTGLVKIIAGWFVAIATKGTLPFWTFLSSGIIDVFVTSGGGHFTVQAPVNIMAAKELGADLTRITMAICYGDTWSNLIQPFWTLLYMPIMAQGLKITIRDFMGFCFLYLFVTGAIYALCVSFLPLTW